MDSLFIEPASLPGGQDWFHACAAATDEAARDALRCGTSSLSGLVQVFLLLCVYGVILFKASQLIANGSELLLLVPSLRHIVGSVILPILGAVPDGAIVLFSGLGPNAQETLSVGVGALAGSTSMLLTIPWFLSILAGRVSLRNGQPNYRPPKLQPPTLGLNTTGVQVQRIVSVNGIIMLITAIPFILIQCAAFLTGNFYGVKTSALTKSAAAFEKIPAFLCVIVCLIFFTWYLWYSVNPPALTAKYNEAMVDHLRLQYIREGTVSMSAAFFDDITSAVHAANESTGLQAGRHKKERLDHLLLVFFNQYDQDNSHSIDKNEFQNVMRDMGEKLSSDELQDIFGKMDSDNDGKIQLEEFIDAIPKFVISRGRKSNLDAVRVASANGEGASVTPPPPHRDNDSQHEEEEEEEDIPDDLRHLNPSAQIKRVKRRAFSMMLYGTVLVLVFSDPMVGVMSDFGRRIGISPFYVSFILAPLASNASEFLAAYSYALKKTRKTVTISFSTLLGAAIMNNTFVLSIFMLLIAVKGLAWQFTAETCSILFVEIFVFIMSRKKVLTLKNGLYTLAIFPLSIVIVAFLENVVGLD